MKFRYRLTVTRCGGLKSLFESHRVSAGGILLSAECAQAARSKAKICGVDVAIDVEVSPVSMQAFANVIRQPAGRQNVACAVERECVVSIKSLAGDHLRMNRLQARIVGLE